MRVITLKCPKCDTIVADNVLESERVMKCPGLDCDEVLEFTDLPISDQRYILDNMDQFNTR